MAKVSKEAIGEVQDYGVSESRTQDLAGYEVSFVSLREDQSLAPLLARLPGGHCPCPYWGYVLKGQLTVRYGESEEVIGAGEAFYLPPGHVPSAAAGSEFVQFSPSEQIRQVEAAMSEAMRQVQGA